MKQGSFLSSSITNVTSWCFGFWLPMLWHTIHAAENPETQNQVT